MDPRERGVGIVSWESASFAYSAEYVPNRLMSYGSRNYR